MSPRLFADDARPRLFALPPGADYARELAAGLLARLDGAPPEAILDVHLLVNTRRAARAMEDAIAEARGEGIGFLPRIAILGEIADSPAAVALSGGAAASLPARVDPLRRLLTLTRLVETWLASGEGRPPVSAAPDLAETLATLLDMLDEEGVAPAQLDGAVDDGMAAHWAEALALADVARARWPEIRAEQEGDVLDPAERQRRAALALVAAWQETPPEVPVVVAGSTGSRAVTALLMQAVAQLPQGAVVLPGFDRGEDWAIWREAGPDHPLGPFRRVFEGLGAAPDAVRPWRGTLAPTPRRRLMSEALRPAPVTDAWIAAAPRLAPEAEVATGGLTLLEAASPREEAAAIALAIRQALETPGRTAMLVTPDATLARRVTAELARFRIVPDDSLGQPLGQSPAGRFHRLLAAAASGAADAVALAALLAHPHAHAGHDRLSHLRLARRYEREVLRARPLGGMPPGTLPPWPDAAGEAETAWLGAVEDALAPLARSFAGGAPLDALVAAHREAAAALSRTPGGTVAAEEGEDGAALGRALEALARAADAHGDAPMREAEYLALLARLIDAETVRLGGARPHPRVSIRGTLEARVETADLVILGGLAEGTWPAPPPPDPWLSRPMRARLGLPSPERSVGLAAHDFLQAACRPDAILTRALRIDGAPSVPSRWLVRLTSLLEGTAPGALAAMRARGEALRALVPLLHRPEPGMETVPAPRPCPKPPVAARPRRLSVTEIETLVRDPYAVYARRVLGLEPLEPIGRGGDARDRGEIVHEALCRFVATAERDADPETEAGRLRASVEEMLAETVPWPDLRRLWRARFARAAGWFAATEALRRAEAEPAGLEVRGRMTIDAPAGPFKLRAKADRIDRLHADPGAALIYDYKTGQPPTPSQIGVFSLQLHLQALILEAGGFEGLPALRAVGGAYIGLTGSGADGGRETRPKTDLAADLERHRAGLASLIAAYDDPAQGYLALASAERESVAGDYDHLSRRAEWEGETGGTDG